MHCLGVLGHKVEGSIYLKKVDYQLAGAFRFYCLVSKNRTVCGGWGIKCSAPRVPQHKTDYGASSITYAHLTSIAARRSYARVGLIALIST